MRLDMPTIRDHAIDAVMKITPDHHPLWGTMGPQSCLLHMAKALNGAHKLVSPQDIRPATIKQRAMSFMILRLAPRLPRGVKAPPSVVFDNPKGDFNTDQAACVEAIRHRTDHLKECLEGAHPFFGPLNENYWSRFHARHLHHHLSQLGVW